jgi:pyruvate ferredoxin oxidoreductase alpha subunit
MFINDLTSPGEFSEMRFQQKEAFARALEIIPRMLDEFAQVFGRKYEMVEAYRCADADAVLVGLGSLTGTAKHAVDEMRSRGEKVGLLKIVSFRPFPAEIIHSILKGKKIAGVIDRSAGLGAQAGPVWMEVRAALPDTRTKIFGYVAGLGGRDIPGKTIERIFHELLKEINSDVQSPRVSWIDTAQDAMDIRISTMNENIEQK